MIKTWASEEYSWFKLLFGTQFGDPCPVCGIIVLTLNFPCGWLGLGFLISKETLLFHLPANFPWPVAIVSFIFSLFSWVFTKKMCLLGFMRTTLSTCLPSATSLKSVRVFKTASQMHSHAERDRRSCRCSGCRNLWACVWRGHRKTYPVLSFLTLFPWDRVSDSEDRYLEGPNDPPFSVPSSTALYLQVHAQPHWDFYMGAWDLNSVPHACTESVLSHLPGPHLLS